MRRDKPRPRTLIELITRGKTLPVPPTFRPEPSDRRHWVLPTATPRSRKKTCAGETTGSQKPIHDVQERGPRPLAASGLIRSRETLGSSTFAGPAVAYPTSRRIGARRWWRRSESNRRPSACKADALPTELRPRQRWWAWVDSNYRPHAYQARALTN